MGISEQIKSIFRKAKKEVKVLQGKQSKDRTYYSRKEFVDPAAAERAFKEASGKLFRIEEWNKVPAIASSRFILYDRNIQPVNNSKPATGYYMKVILPGPVPENWVMVTHVREEDFLSEFTVTPCPDPTKNTTNSESTEHFFKSGTTSTFRVSLNKNILSAYEIGKNETPNNRGKEAGNRGAINTAIAAGGWIGFQKYQWKNLTDYLIGIQ